MINTTGETTEICSPFELEMLLKLGDSELNFVREIEEVEVLGGKTSEIRAGGNPGQDAFDGDIFPGFKTFPLPGPAALNSLGRTGLETPPLQIKTSRAQGKSIPTTQNITDRYYRRHPNILHLRSIDVGLETAEQNSLQLKNSQGSGRSHFLVLHQSASGFAGRRVQRIGLKSEEVWRWSASDKVDKLELILLPTAIYTRLRGFVRSPYSRLLEPG